MKSSSLRPWAAKKDRRKAVSLTRHARFILTHWASFKRLRLALALRTHALHALVYAPCACAGPGGASASAPVPVSVPVPVRASGQWPVASPVCSVSSPVARGARAFFLLFAFLLFAFCALLPLPPVPGASAQWPVASGARALALACCRLPLGAWRLPPRHPVTAAPPLQFATPSCLDP
jgi:hypothetical protein